MKLISWADRQPGDVALVEGTGIVANLIIAFERALTPEYQDEFIPSHACIVGYEGMIIEATLSLTEDSVATINPASKYDNSNLRLWRIDRTPLEVANAIDLFVRQYAGNAYGWPELLGFVLEAASRVVGDFDAHNLITMGYVCSMAGLLFFREPSQEKWPAIANLYDCHPLRLHMHGLANQTI